MSITWEEIQIEHEDDRGAWADYDSDGSVDSVNKISYADAVGRAYLADEPEDPEIHQDPEHIKVQTKPGGPRPQAAHVHTLEVGVPVGIRQVQTIMMSATQSNLSHFHTAGMANARAITAEPSVADAMNSVYKPCNTSMKFKIKDVNIQRVRGLLVGSTLKDFVTSVKSRDTGLPDRENIWYENDMYEGGILRFYVDYGKLKRFGLTLQELARKSITDCDWAVSPDFMGMIDVNMPDSYMAPWLSKLQTVVCGTTNVLSCEMSQGVVSTVGTDVALACTIEGVDKTSLTCNDIKSVEKHFGIEAAAGVLSELLKSSVISDFMARTGKILPFSKHSEEVGRKGLLMSMGFERPRDDIKKAAVSHVQRANNESVYGCIMVGKDMPSLFTATVHRT